MSLPISHEVLIVGAGPVGLTLAIDLARRGVAVRVIDARPTPSPLSRATEVQPRSLEIFEALGRDCYHHADRIIALYETNRLRQIKDGAPAERT